MNKIKTLCNFDAEDVNERPVSRVIIAVHYDQVNIIGEHKVDVNGDS